MPRFRSIGFMPAATDFMPSRTIAWARTVAVVVPSPAMSLVLEATSRSICAPMFSNLSFEFDFLGDGDAVLGDARCAEALVDDDVAALGAERHLHRVGEDVDAAQNALTRIAARILRLWLPLCGTPSDYDGGSREEVIERIRRAFGSARSSTPRMSLSFMISRSSPSTLTSVPDHLPNRMRSPALTSSGVILPSSSRAPVPTATTSPSCGFSLAVSGMMMPPAVFFFLDARRARGRAADGISWV